MLRIAAAIERLPERQREVAIRHLLLGQTLHEVAVALSCSKGVVGNLHRGAIKQLRQELEGLLE